MEQIRNFIDLLGQGDNVGAKDALSELLASRAFEALESKKQGIAGTLFNTEEVEDLNEDPSDGGGSDIRHHYNPKGEKPKLGKSGTHVLDTGKGKYKVLQAPASNRLNYGKPVKRGAEITNAHLSDHYEYGRGVVHVHTHNPKEAMMSRADADRHFE